MSHNEPRPLSGGPQPGLPQRKDSSLLYPRAQLGFRAPDTENQTHLLPKTRPCQPVLGPSAALLATTPPQLPHPLALGSALPGVPRPHPWLLRVPSTCILSGPGVCSWARTCDLPPQHPPLDETFARCTRPSPSQASPPPPSPGRRARRHSLASRRVHQQGDEGGRGRADAVQGQHGVLALLLTHHVVCGQDGRWMPPAPSAPQSPAHLPPRCPPQTRPRRCSADVPALPGPGLLPSLTPAPAAGLHGVPLHRPRWG